MAERISGPARTRFRILAAGGALVAVTALSACVTPTGPVQPTPVVVYDATPSPVPGNVPSLGAQARSTQEVGDHIGLAGTERKLRQATVTMSAWGLASTPSNVTYCAGAGDSCGASGWKHEVTVNIYRVDNTGPVPTVGDLLGSAIKVITVPWRPEADPTCSTTTAWRAADGNCYNGKAFDATFDLTGLNIVAPDEVIVGVAYNTTNHGYAPLGGSGGPYDSLNVGLSVAPPTVGTDVDADAIFFNSSFAGFYTDGGLAGVGIFRQDTDWSGYVPAIELSAV